MIQIGVKSTIDDVLKELSVFDADQLPFAVAKALTDTAKDAQQAVRASMPSHFTLRRDWIVQGIRIVPATKWLPVATVYSVDPFMGRQETGGLKVPMQAGGRYVAVPLDARPNKGDLIPEAWLPANLGQATYTTSRRGKQIPMPGTGGTAFRLQANNGKLYLALRVPGQGLKLMYTLVPAANIKPALGLESTTLRIVQERFALNFEAALNLAMATAKSGGSVASIASN